MIVLILTQPSSVPFQVTINTMNVTALGKELAHKINLTYV